MSNKNIVSTQWLDDHLNSPDTVVVDGSWHLPGEKRDAYAEYLEEHIPGAIFFDIDDISDSDTSFPHMLPSTIKFSSKVRKLGIGDGKQIVIYDNSDLRSSARVWWMFRLMGVQEVSILDGGLAKWKSEDRELDFGKPRLQERHFTARKESSMVRNADEVLKITKEGGAQIIDARSAGRFNGTEAEPRPNLRSGRIPGSFNLPYNEVLQEDGTLKSVSALHEIFKNAGVDISKPIVTSCGSGITASVLALALDTIGSNNVAVYDGSWSEWGSREDLPIERD